VDAAAADILPRPTVEELAAELVVARVGCVRCHEAPNAEAEHMLPLAGPDLGDAARWHGGDGGAAFLRRHHGGEHAEDLAAWIVSLAADAPALQPASTADAIMARGEQLFRELACGACHAPGLLAGLSGRTDHAHVTAFLVDPSAHRPGVPHDFGLSVGEAESLAAWLLRKQVRDDGEPAIRGFAYECFEVNIASEDPPDLEGLEPSGHGIVEVIDTEPKTRGNHFALRFESMIDVPSSGEWTFTVGSDDSSWLWIDGDLIVDNAGLAPHRRRKGKVRLDAGSHALRVLYTEAGGHESLEVLWQGPGVDEQPIPAERASAVTVVLAPPDPLPPPDPEAVARGRAAAVELRCTACHAVADPLLERLPPPPPARPWHQLGDGSCPAEPAATAVFGILGDGSGSQRDEAARLDLALRRDRCLSCHSRDGQGGLQPAVRRHLVDVADLGEEGRMPPDLTKVGQRLREEWIVKVLEEGHKVRPYVRVRMPRMSRERAERYARWFAAVDGAPVTDEEPEFSAAAVEQGHALGGVKGKNCISCHMFAGQPSTGSQGMDLAIQHQRLRPAWFREWLLRAAVVRPGTRMPLFWPSASEADRGEVDAIRTWLSLGAASPLPEGIVPEKGSLTLLPTDRPILHGAFLEGLSARCIAVGTRERTHFAYDVENGRLAWIWRGDFLDATGTWHGRAGKLLKPLGQDWLRLQDFVIDGGDERVVLGHRITADGYPVFRVRAGDVEFEDGVHARLSAAGSEIVRTLRCIKGTLSLEWPEQDGLRLFVAGEPAAPTSVIRAGESLEVVYRW